MKPSVKLIAISNPITANIDPDSPNPILPKDLIAYCARVSNPSNQTKFNTAEKLLKYCMDNGHWSIFEMVHLVIEIKTTRDIGRQILRHRSFSFQEFSQRYAEVDSEFEARETRLQDFKNRQNSVETLDEELQSKWSELQKSIYKLTVESYKKAIELGIAKEVARVVLPEGLTPSVMYMGGTLRSWIHYCKLRRGNGTQKEHREIADMVFNILTEHFSFLKEENHQVYNPDTDTKYKMEYQGETLTFAEMPMDTEFEKTYTKPTDVKLYKRYRIPFTSILDIFKNLFKL